MTREVAETVQIMVDNLIDPALLDRASIRFWLDAPNPPRTVVVAFSVHRKAPPVTDWPQPSTVTCATVLRCTARQSGWP